MAFDFDVPVCVRYRGTAPPGTTRATKSLPRRELDSARAALLVAAGFVPSRPHITATLVVTGHGEQLLQFGRRAVGIGPEERYCEAAALRLEQALREGLDRVA
jgi:hypothetical protein